MPDADQPCYSYASALDLPAIDRRALLAGPDFGVWVAPPGQTRHRSRAQPAFHDDPDRVGLFRNDLASLPIAAPPAFAVRTGDVRLVGHRTLLTADGRLFNDEPGIDAAATRAYLNRLAGAGGSFFTEDTGLVSSGAGFVLTDADRREVRIAEPVLVLCANEPWNYGSFLFRVLPKLAMFGSAPPDMPVLVHIAHPSFRDLLEIAGIKPARIIEHDSRTIWRLAAALLPGMRNPDAYLDDASRGFYAWIKARLGAGRTGDGRRIYVSRRGFVGSNRPMLNEAEVEDALAGIGFDILRPHDMTARAQIAAFANAAMVVGPAGSAMFNCVFCAPGTMVVDIESEPHWVHAHACLFSSCQLNWGIFEGRVTDPANRLHHQPFTVNIQALLRRVS